MTQITVEKILHEIDEMDHEDRDYLAEVLPKRFADIRRAEIAEQAAADLENYRQGKLKSGSVDDLLRNLNG